MNKGIISIGESELEIMKVLWKVDEKVPYSVISSAVEEKNWKKTTIATFLTRLSEKGAISAEKEGKIYYYKALLSEKDYRKNQTESLINSLFGGSVKEFAVSLFKDGSLSEEDLKELKAVIDERGE